MRRLAAARREVIGAMTPLPEAIVPLGEARGLVVSSDIVAQHDLPPFANTGVDGFAVRAADTAAAPVDLVVVEDVPAGRVPSHAVGEGEAIRIMTGAPMPLGADAVVMVEDTTSTADRVQVLRPAVPGDHIRPAGGDVAAGAVVLRAGDRLRPAHLGVLAALGVVDVPVTRRPRVAVASTGDEVLPPEAALRPGTIRDANRPLLIGLLDELGVAVHDLGIIPDDARLLRSVLEEAAATSDAVITSGGVSMGDYDLVKQVLGDLGRIEFWQVAMQPAKPFAFGALGVTPFFGLPGNPVSVLVAFEQFVRPALLARMGARRLFRPRVMARLGEAVSTNPTKVVFVRVAWAGSGVVVPAGGQGSNVLSAAAAADGFAVIPVGVGEVAAGSEVTVEVFGAAETRTLGEADDD